MSFTVYKSSAGSGKTFTLVKEYIKLAIQKPGQFRHILAITFTNKAANEMKERVIRYLTELSSDPLDKTTDAYKFLLPELLKDASFTEEEISVKASQVLNSILHNYSDFAIGTIDSFVHRIIRTFAHDLKIPMNFEVEMDTDKLLAEAIDLLLNKAGSDELLTKILVEFTEAKTDDEKSWHIESDLKIFASQLFKEDNILYIEKIRNLSIQDFLDIRKKLAANISKFENSIIKIADEACKLIIENNIPFEAFYQGNKGIGKYYQNLANGCIDKIAPNSYVSDTVEQDKWYAGKATTEDRKKIDTIKGQLGDAYLEIAKLKDKNYKNYILYTLIHANIYPVAVLSEIEKIIEEMKMENNILPISEFNKRISGIVISQPVPFIYERLGEKYYNYLIDEFQDTSSLQWINILPLIENSLSIGKFNMIVGDGKQAIYRWRGGDVEQFAILPELSEVISDEFSKERAEALKRNYLEKNLSSNFRSKAEIIDFNNKFFSHIAKISSDYIKKIYTDCEQSYDKENTGGYVQIDFLNNTDSEDETYDEITFKKITQIINELIEQNFLYSDIAILCRSNDDASDIARYLISIGIRVVSEESLLITCSREVNFLLAFANFISNNDNDIAKYRILHYLISHRLVFDNDIYTACKILRRNNSGKDNSIDTELFCEYLQKNNFKLDINLLSSLPIFELFEILISCFKFNKTTDSYIRFFMDAVYEFLSGKKTNISEFLDWWEEQKSKRSIIAPEGMDSVKIMTIHKSKGLEFPVVIYPHATARFRNTNDNLWINTDIVEIPELKSSLIRNDKIIEQTDYSELYRSEKDKSLLDLLNVLYVVMTRASERLYILSKPPSEKFSEPKAIPDFLASYLHTTNQWDENKTIYNFGNNIPRIKKEDKKEGSSKLKLNPFPLKSGKQLIHLRKKSTDAWDTEDPLRNSQWGNLVHHTLSLIHDTENIESTVAMLVQNGIIVKEREKELEEKIKSIIADPALSNYFKPDCEVKTETEILLKDGSTMRPDRVVIEGRKAIVIDYKTGRMNDSHKKQIQSYAETLAEMGYTEIEKILVYFDLNKIVLVK